MNYQVPHPNLLCSNLPLLSWFVPGGIPHKTFICLEGREEAGPGSVLLMWGFHLYA